MPVSSDRKKEQDSPSFKQKCQSQNRSKRVSYVFNVANNHIPSLVLLNLNRGAILRQADRKHLFAAIYEEFTKYTY